MLELSIYIAITLIFGGFIYLLLLGLGIHTSLRRIRKLSIHKEELVTQISEDDPESFIDRINGMPDKELSGEAPTDTEEVPSETDQSDNVKKSITLHRGEESIEPDLINGDPESHLRSFITPHEFSREGDKSTEISRRVSELDIKV